MGFELGSGVLKNVRQGSRIVKISRSSRGSHCGNGLLRFKVDDSR